MFGSESVLSQRVVNNLTKKYHIPDVYNCRAPERKEYMLDLKDKEIIILVAHLEAGMRFPLHPFFIWLIKRFYIQPG